MYLNAFHIHYSRSTSLEILIRKWFDNSGIFQQLWIITCIVFPVDQSIKKIILNEICYYFLFQEDISNELLNDMESVLNVNKLDNILAGDNSLTWLWNRNKLHIPCCISTPLSHDTRSCDHQKQCMRNLMYCQTLCCTVIVKVLFFNRFFC